MPEDPRQQFEAAALPHLDAMFGSALRLTRNRTEAEDLVQDTYVRAFRFWHTFAAGTNPKPWLLTILRNTFINRFHRTNRRREHRDELRRQVDATPALALARTEQGAFGPEQVVAQKMTREKILAALDTLPEEYRTAVALADLEGLAYKEIAEVMSCPIGTVMSRLYRGRKLLAKLLKAPPPGASKPTSHADATAPRRKPRRDPSPAADSTPSAALEPPIELRAYRRQAST